MLRIENKFGKQCVMNGNLLKGILNDGETLDEFLIRIAKKKEKHPKTITEKPIIRRLVNYGIEDKSLIGTVIII